MSLFESLFGSYHSRLLKKIQPIVKSINALADTMASLSDNDIKTYTEKLKHRIVQGESLEALLPEAFALVREVSTRTLGQRHYDVQLIGGIALFQNTIAEMRTGEGKTLVATLPAYLQALTGKGVHIVTVNDYLARRDAVWMGQIYSALGLTVGVINDQRGSYLYDPTHIELDEKRDAEGDYKIVYEFLRPCSRAEAYAADITYGTNNEYAFDYLRDNIEYNKGSVSQRGHVYAIIDEVDSILIDEARNPLIISSPSDIPKEKYIEFDQIASRLEIGVDYSIDEKLKAVSILPPGIAKVEKALSVQNLYSDGNQKNIHFLTNALKAHALYKKDNQYVVHDGKIVIVDEFTGRLQPGRQWREGLHQALEAKERIAIQAETRTYASITFQNYFRMYEKLAGMTGTGISSQEEFYKVYKLQVFSVPTHRPITRIDHVDIIYQSKKAKHVAIVAKVKELQSKGTPVLVGTNSIEANTEISAIFNKAGIQHTVLNAKNHEQEGAIIAQAGSYKKVTIATNLAGRGVDIKLGGHDADDEARKKIIDVGGLFVLGTVRNETRRSDDQLRGRAGRQGDAGETQFFISLEDELVRIFATDKIANLARSLGLPEDQAIQSSIISQAIESAQKRIEGHHFDARRYNFEYDTVLNAHRTDVYKKRKNMLYTDGTGIASVAMTLLSPETVILMNEKIEKGGAGLWEPVRQAVLRAIDVCWIGHLEYMEIARESVNLRAYGQRDPLTEYKHEGSRLFKGFWEQVDIVSKEHIKAIPISLTGGQK
ncbi:MAG: preprotein translocase subunit SecA [Alphaproteobacteria bacterium]|nr:preprotein translocase subunit SecA [Alphaproteobacteria bacterium]